jgi:hypothetical protein
MHLTIILHERATSEHIETLELMPTPSSILTPSSNTEPMSENYRDVTSVVCLANSVIISLHIAKSYFLIWSYLWSDS